MKITKYVHSTFELEMGDKRILIDPGKYNFGGGRFDLDYLKKEDLNDADIILLSHSHGDHYDADVITNLYEKSNPVIISNEEVGKDLQERNIEHIVLKPGEKTEVDNISVGATYCDHKVPCVGFLLNDGNQTAYFVADSLYKESNQKADVLFVPIGNRDVVMSPTDAAKFTSEIEPNLVIPMHYESPKDQTMPVDFEIAMQKIRSNTEIKSMEYKETINF
ncbi:MBL fold metallo-hydrolase [Candidatus Woesearchaeota archaeon]|nr:MBL fold metallo-hydrolase [Candidatus Woesearchaeota archaeon]